MSSTAPMSTTDVLPTPRVIHTTATEVTVMTADLGPVSATWQELIDAARQPDVDLGAAYADLVVQALDNETRRVSRVHVRVDGSVEDEAHNGAACVAYVGLDADGYLLASDIPATRRRADEGGTHPSWRGAESELQDRLARVRAVEPAINGRLASEVSTWTQIRYAVAMRHHLVNVVGEIEIRR